MTAEEAKAALGISKTCKTILFFGAIRPNKGLDNLLRALPQIRRDVPDIKLLIVGEPCENYKRYSLIIEREDIRKHVFEKLDYIPNNEVNLYFYASDVNFIYIRTLYSVKKGYDHSPVVGIPRE